MGCARVLQRRCAAGGRSRRSLARQRDLGRAGQFLHAVPVHQQQLVVIEAESQPARCCRRSAECLCAPAWPGHARPGHGSRPQSPRNRARRYGPAGPAHRLQDVGVFREGDDRGFARPLFLSSRRSAPPVASRRRQRSRRKCPRAGSSRSVASSICRADVTSTTIDAARRRRLTGPATSVTSAPASRAARAMAKPILPENGW